MNLVGSTWTSVCRGPIICGQLPGGEVTFGGSEQRLWVWAWEAVVREQSSWVNGAGEARSQPPSSPSAERWVLFSEAWALYEAEFSHLHGCGGRGRGGGERSEDVVLDLSPALCAQSPLPVSPSPHCLACLPLGSSEACLPLPGLCRQPGSEGCLTSMD